MFKLKDKISKRIHPWPNVKYDLLKSWRGLRSCKGVDQPIHLMRASHAHVYMTLACNLNCRYCINTQIHDPIAFKAERDPDKWIKLLNRLCMVGELYFNGGEHFMLPYFTDVINGLRNHSLLIFTNLPEKGMDNIRRLKRNDNNIFLDISYHPLQDVPVNMFVERLRQIPKGINWNIHIIRDPEISAYLYLDAFRRYGIYGVGLDCIYNPELKYESKVKVKCKPNEHIIGPDMRRHRCLLHLLYGWEGMQIDDGRPDVSWSHDWIECDLYPRCKIDCAYMEVKLL
jgi:hypothetical protein